MYFQITNFTDHDRFNELSRCWAPVQQVLALQGPGGEAT